jgi:hypothetical protein
MKGLILGGACGNDTLGERVLSSLKGELHLHGW